MFTWYTFPAFIVAIGVLVTIHELGHYWVARWCNVKILRFSVGFGKPLWMRRFGADQTEWVIAAIPLGGYVKMADERDGSAEVDAPLAIKKRAFNNKPVWQRIAIVLAGPVANFILAAFFYWALFVAGTPGVKPYLAPPIADSVAERAGFADFDLITKVGNREVHTWGDARMALLEAAVARGSTESGEPGASVEIEVDNNTGQRITKRLPLSSLVKEDLDKDFLAKLGLRDFRLKPLLVAEELTPSGAASKAGFKVGDRILAIGGQSLGIPEAQFTVLNNWQEMVAIVTQSAGRPLIFIIERDGHQMEKTVTPDSVTENGKTLGRIGVRPSFDKTLEEKLKTTVRYAPFAAIGYAWIEVWDKSIFSLKMMGHMIAGDISWKNLSGPLAIAEFAGKAAERGLAWYVGFLALISVSLGVLNLLPIPVLDGGQLMYYMAEVFKGSPVSERTMEIGQQIGLTLLLGMTAFAFYNDIHRLVAG